MKRILLVCLVFAFSLASYAAEVDLSDGSLDSSQTISAPFDIGDFGLGGKTLPPTIWGVQLHFLITQALTYSSPQSGNGAYIPVNNVLFAPMGNVSNGAPNSFTACGSFNITAGASQSTRYDLTCQLTPTQVSSLQAMFSGGLVGFGFNGALSPQGSLPSLLFGSLPAIGDIPAGAQAVLGILDTAPASVPEPSSALLLLAGSAVLVLGRKRMA